MLDWFRKKEAQKLVFDDNDKAFAHACTLNYRPLIGALIPALVVEEGGRGKDGEHTFLIRLACGLSDRPFWTSTLKGAPGQPEAGDLVGFRIVTIASDLPVEVSLIGYLACRLAPVFVSGKGWVTNLSYTPEDLKPELHL